VAAIAGILNGTISTIEANAITKTASKQIKLQNKALKEFKRCSKIAASRNEKLVVIKK